MELVASFGGYQITVGVVASVLAQAFKSLPFVPVWKGEPVKIRAVVGLLCVLLNVGVTLATGGDLSSVVVLESFVSYFTAAATYDHLFR